MRFSLKLLLLALVAFLGAATAWGQEKIRITGSTTVLPIAQKAAENFMAQTPGLEINVSGTGTGEGLKTLLAGHAEISNASRDLKAKELELARQANQALTKHIVALDCIVVVVNPQNPVADLTLDQLQDIYTGRLKNWKELGGPDWPIVAINRDTSSGTFELWLEKVLKGQRAHPGVQVQPSNGGVAQAVAGNRFAVGYVGLGYLNKDLKPLKVNGQSPSASTAKDGSYPLARELYMFTAGEPRGKVKDFIDFILSADGQRLVEKEGFVTVLPERGPF